MQRLGAAVDTRAGRVRFADRIVQTRLDAALATLDQPAGVRSVAAAARGDAPPFALHLLPLRRAARDVFRLVQLWRGHQRQRADYRKQRYKQ